MVTKLRFFVRKIDYEELIEKDTNNMKEEKNRVETKDKSVWKCKIKLPLISYIANILCAVYPLFFLFFKNAAEMSFGEIKGVLCFSILFATIVFVTMVCLMREWSKGGIISLIFIILCENYSIIAMLINFVFKDMKYWHIVMILLFFYIWLCVWIKKDNRKGLFDIVISISGLLFGTLVLINFLGAIPIFNRASLNDNRAEVAPMEGYENLPNIYYLILDECASFNVIKEHYGYTDTSFYDYLEKNNFVISENSYNDSTHTHVIMTNCLNLDYIVTDDVPVDVTQSYRENPPLYQLFKRKGYSIRGIGETEWLGVDSITSSDTVSIAKTISGETATQVFLRQTIMGPFVSRIEKEEAAKIREAFATMQRSDIITPNSSVFTLFYVQSPHEPFLFDENGNSVLPSNYTNWQDDRYYLGQYRYVINEVQKCVENILNNDPDSVILVTSDHGPRSKEGLTIDEKKNILNCVYFMGYKINKIKDQSQVNTWRVILNELFEMNYEMVEIKK